MEILTSTILSYLYRIINDTREDKVIETTDLSFQDVTILCLQVHAPYVYTQPWLDHGVGCWTRPLVQPVIPIRGVHFKRFNYTWISGE